MQDTYAKKIAAEYPGFLFKRAPSGFFGMRGKKQNNEGIKRAPYGFTGKLQYNIYIHTSDILVLTSYVNSLIGQVKILLYLSYGNSCIEFE